MCLKDKIKACVYISTSIKLHLLIADMEFVLFTIFPAGNILFHSCTCSLIFVLMNELLTKYIHWHFSKFSPPPLYPNSSHRCLQLGFSASIFFSTVYFQQSRQNDNQYPPVVSIYLQRKPKVLMMSSKHEKSGPHCLKNLFSSNFNPLWHYFIHIGFLLFLEHTKHTLPSGPLHLTVLSGKLFIHLSTQFPPSLSLSLFSNINLF